MRDWLLSRFYFRLTLFQTGWHVRHCCFPQLFQSISLSFLTLFGDYDESNGRDLDVHFGIFQSPLYTVDISSLSGIDWSVETWMSREQIEKKRERKTSMKEQSIKTVDWEQPTLKKKIRKNERKPDLVSMLTYTVMVCDRSRENESWITKMLAL